MIFGNPNGDPRSFMYYKNTFYINGTEITLKEEYRKKHTFNGQKLWKYAKFHHQTRYNNCNAYFFCISRADWLSLAEMGLDARAANEYASYFVITALELEYAIDEITKPIKVTEEQHHAIMKGIENMINKKDWDYPELRILWIIYVIVMIGSLIFKEFYIMWLIATITFYRIRGAIKK